MRSQLAELVVWSRFDAFQSAAGYISGTGPQPQKRRHRERRQDARSASERTSDLFRIPESFGRGTGKQEGEFSVAPAWPAQALHTAGRGYRRITICLVLLDAHSYLSRNITRHLATIAKSPVILRPSCRQANQTLSLWVAYRGGSQMILKTLTRNPSS